MCAPALVPANGKEFWVQKCSFLARVQLPGPHVARAVPAAAGPAVGEGLCHAGAWGGPRGFAPGTIALLAPGVALKGGM